MKQSGIVKITIVLFRILLFIVAGGVFAQQGNSNMVSVQTALSTICSNLDQLPSPSSSQLELLSSCTSIENNQGQGFTLNENRLAPEEAFVFSDSIVNLAGLRVNNSLSRLALLRRGDENTEIARSQTVMTPEEGVTSNMTVSPTAGTAGDVTERAMSLYVDARFGFSQFESGGLQVATDNYSGAVSVWTSFRFNSMLIAGAALNFLRQDTEFFTDDGDVYMNAGGVSFYGTWFHKNRGYADVVLDLGYHKFNLLRKVNLFNENRQFALGKIDATVASLTMGGGRDFNRLGFEFGPYFRISLTQGRVSGYTESPYELDGGSGSLLYVSSHTASSKKLSAGAHLSRVFGKNKRLSLIPHLRAEVETELEDRKDNITANFLHDPGNTTITVQGDRRDRLYVNTGLGLMLLSRTGNSAYLAAESQWKNDYVQQHWLKFGFRLAF